MKIPLIRMYLKFLHIVNKLIFEYHCFDIFKLSQLPKKHFGTLIHVTTNKILFSSFFCLDNYGKKVKFVSAICLCFSEYWLRLQFLLRISTKRLQQFFRIRYEQLNSVCWKPEYGAVYIEREKDVSKLLNKDQKAAMTIGVVEEWDISLLATLFLNDNALLGNNEHLKSHIKRLKEIRNQIAHNSSMSVPESTFESLWKELEQILIVSGESSSKLDQLRNLSTFKLLIYLVNILGFNEMEGVYHHGVVSEDMEKWKKLANDSFHASKFEEALEYYGKALRIPNLTDVNRGTLYSNRSVAHLKLENFEQSYADAKLAQQLRPDWPRSYLRKGNALLAMKNYAKAVLGNL